MAEDSVSRYGIKTGSKVHVASMNGFIHAALTQKSLLSRLVLVCFTGCALLLTILCSSGCVTAEGARSDKMVARSTNYSSSALALRSAISVGKVNGGHETNPFYMSDVSNLEFQNALVQSLSLNQMLAPNGQTGYFELSAEIDTLRRPSFGIDMTVSVPISWSLTDQATGTNVYARRIVSSYTATPNDEFVGVRRLQVALEGAVRKNIESLLADFSTAQIKGVTDHKKPVNSLQSRILEQVSAPAPIATGRDNPLFVKKWKYDQQTQKAEFEFIVKDDAADMFTLREWALQQIRMICADEYSSANPGVKAGILGFSIVSSLDRPDFRVNVAVYRIHPMGHRYDSATRTGVLTVNIGNQGDANYAGAYKWALDNIGVICASKEVAVEAGQPLPEGSKFEILSEKTAEDGTLEITFRAI